MVGLGIGVSSDDGFVPYFVAITFHQFFDGCGESWQDSVFSRPDLTFFSGTCTAIGTRMALLNFVNKRRKQFIMFGE